MTTFSVVEICECTEDLQGFNFTAHSQKLQSVEFNGYQRQVSDYKNNRDLKAITELSTNNINIHDGEKDCYTLYTVMKIERMEQRYGPASV